MARIALEQRAMAIDRPRFRRLIADSPVGTMLAVHVRHKRWASLELLVAQPAIDVARVLQVHVLGQESVGFEWLVAQAALECGRGVVVDALQVAL